MAMNAFTSLHASGFEGACSCMVTAQQSVITADLGKGRADMLLLCPLWVLGRDPKWKGWERDPDCEQSKVVMPCIQQTDVIVMVS